MGTMPGWLWIDGTEVLNDSRLMANLPCRLGNLVINVHEDPCPGLLEDPTDGSALVASPTTNPWYDANDPDSEEFLGFWVMESNLNATIERATYPRGIARGGSNLGRVQRKHRELAFEVLLVAETDAGLRWGYDWLAAQLDPLVACDTSVALVRLWCPDEDDYLDGLWELREVGVIDPPKWGTSPLKRSGCVIRQATFTIAAGDPWRYSTVEDLLVSEETMPLADDCTDAGSGDDSSANFLSYVCPAELPDLRITELVTGPGLRGQRDVSVLIDGTIEGAAAMRVRSRETFEWENQPDPEAYEMLWQELPSTEIPAASGGFTTADTIAPGANDAVVVMVWLHSNPQTTPLVSATTNLPVLSGGGITNWERLGASMPQTTPTTPKGFFAFVGQAGPTAPTPDELSLTVDPDTAWHAQVLAIGVRNVFVGEFARDCLRQFVIDKKHADNYGGIGGDADEVQKLTRTSTGGTVTLSWNGQGPTATIPASAAGFTAAAVQAALEGLSNIGVGEAVCSGPAGGPIRVWFQGTLAGANQVLMTVDNSLATGGTVVASGLGDGGGLVPIESKTWWPFMIDPAAFENSLILAAGFHGDDQQTVELNDSDGYEFVTTTDGVTPGARAGANASINVSWCASAKVGLEIGENPPMFRWGETFISTGGICFEFLPAIYDRSQRLMPTIHWVSDKSVAGSAAQGRWPVDIERSVAENLDGIAVAYLVSSQQDQPWTAPAGFTTVTGYPFDNAGVTAALGESHTICWIRPTVGMAAPTFPDSGDHQIVVGVMLKGVPETGDIINAIAFSKKDTASALSENPGVTSTEDACLGLIWTSRGDDNANLRWPTGPAYDYGGDVVPDDITAEGPAQLIRLASPYDVEGSGEDAGRELTGETQVSSTVGTGSGVLLLSAALAEAGPSGAFTASIENSAEEVYSAIAVVGAEPEIEATETIYLSDCVTCRLRTGERLLIDSSKLEVLFDDGGGEWIDGAGKIRCVRGGYPWISVRGNDVIVVIVEPANLLGHSTLAEISIFTRDKVGV